MSQYSEIQDVLFKAKKEIADWAEEKFKILDQDYWQNKILPCLSYQQTQISEEKCFNSICQLDLAGILRAIDKNWYELNFKFSLGQQQRSYLKELQIIRNKYAHISEELNEKDVARDLDTVERFLNGLQREPVSKNEDVIEVENEIVKNNTTDVVPQIPSILEDTINKISSDEINVKDMVCLKTDKEKRGVVISIDNGEYNVFMDNEFKTLYLDQIVKYEKEQVPFVKLSTVRNYLSSFILKHPSISSLYSLNSARIDLIPYQFKPVMKMIQSEQPRLLIADSVGIGKTIEAGLILRELQIRNDIKSVLIICPKPLVTEKKWQQEMKRFDEEFAHLNSADLNYCISECDMEGEWPEKFSKCILPFSICNEEYLIKLQKLNPFPKFDLVIVDEAHNIRNSSTSRYAVVQQFCEHAEAIVFLTATPIQMRDNDLFTLLNLLRPDLIPDKSVFDVMHEPNKFITSAISNIKLKNYEDAKNNLLEADKVFNASLSKRPDFDEIMEKLDSSDLTMEQQVELVNSVSKMHTFDSLINRTKRKEIADDFCKRHPETVRNVFSAKEQELYDELIDLRRKILMEKHGKPNVKFFMTTLMRQAASCLQGLAPLINDIMHTNLLDTDIEFDEFDFESVIIEKEVLQNHLDEILDLIKKADNLPDYDPKFESFYKVIEEKQNLENKKVIVFSTFRHTLSYLYEKLTEKGIRVGLIHGGVKDDERRKIRERFEKPYTDENALDVLLFSEVGCEGLDYQFCDTMINYDLPWNPMKIEQRIGRIDRFGQKSEAVAIYNMIVDGTIDADIYDRCLFRIKIFEQSIGDCDEILGEIHSEIQSICENITLTNEERAQKLEELTRNKYRFLLDKQKLEDEQSTLFSIPAEVSARKTFESFENYWISPLALEKLVKAYLFKITNTTANILGNGKHRTLRLSQEAKSKLYNDYLQLSVKKGKIYKDWEKYLKSFDQTCSITFDTECASKDVNVQFIMPLHPLVKQAVKSFEARMPIKTSLKVVDNDIEEGQYPFMVYSWDYKGDLPAVKLKAVCPQEHIQSKLLDYLENGAEINEIVLQDKSYDQMRLQVKNMRDAELERYKLDSKKWAEYRIQSLDISTRARINVAKKLSQGHGVEHIQANWVNSIQKDAAEKIEKIKKTTELSDIESKIILSGVVQIVHEA